jgi:putative membrane protein
MPGPFHVYINGPGNGWWIGGMVVSLLFWAAIVLLIVAAIRHFGGDHRHVPPSAPGTPSPSSSAGTQSALDTLKMRFARGEIDEEEYTRRADLLSSGH